MFAKLWSALNFGPTRELSNSALLSLRHFTDNLSPSRTVEPARRSHDGEPIHQREEVNRS
jgi:hypothetical protein